METNEDTKGGEDQMEQANNQQDLEFDPNPYRAALQDTQGCMPVYFHYNSPTSDVNDFDPSFPSSVIKESIGQPPEQGVCGLYNLGNTCFMNAGLQCLFNNARLCQCLLEENGDDTDSITGCFHQLFTQAWSGQQARHRPLQFKEMLGSCHPQFKDFRQHDCQEFLALLLDSLHEQLNKSRRSVPRRDLNRREDNILFSPPQGFCPREIIGIEAIEKPTEVEEAPEVVNQSDGNLVEMKPDEPEEAASPSCTSDMTLESCGSELNNDLKGVTVDTQPLESQFVLNGSSFDELPGCQAAINDFTKPICVDTGDLTEDIDDDEVKKLPSLEDLYMKNTKVKNTNVISSIAEENIATDSDKFVKCDNFDISQQVTEEYQHEEQLSDLLGYEETSTKDIAECCKPFKETNLLANVKDKFAGEFFTKKSLFSDLSPTGSDYSINNIKRMKIEEDEKNLKMVAKRKVNMEKNSTQDGRSLEGQIPTNMEVLVAEAAGLGSTLPQQLSPGSLSFRINNNEGQLRRRYIQEAEDAWSRYTEANQSAISDTFHGQFKSTVVCSECHHISVTFEPFMYLSVPLPHAMERQINVIFIPCDKQPIQYLATVNKPDCVKSLRQALLSLIGEESCDIILAEVCHNHVARILEDTMRLVMVNDTDRVIYAFEMIPLPEVDSSSQSEEPTDCDTQPPPNNSQSCVAIPFQNNSLTNSIVATESDRDGSDMVHDAGPVLNNSSVLVEESNAATQSLEQRPDINWQRNLLTDQEQMQPPLVPTSVKGSDEHKEDGTLATEERNLVGVSDDQGMGRGGDVGGWKSCAICLEDMMDADLLVHVTCGGTLCQNCLEMSFKHYGETPFQCPVCSTQTNPDQEFVQLNRMEDYKPTTRMLSVPIMHRLDEEGTRGRLFGHPNLLYLSSELSGEALYDRVDRVVACPGQYTILLTDGQGYHCSRCGYTSTCRGCIVPRDADISLRPGDHLTVCFTQLSAGHLQAAEDYIKHSSMALKRPHHPLTLFDCFRAFTQSETLDEHNPWFCPMCRKNQCASKTMTVWRYPQSLIVHLKRFVFHNLNGSKIDNQVLFPLDGLDLTPFTSGPHSHDLTYELRGAVCHFGGVTSGHYTAYAKHPISNVWHYYNDEHTCKQQPMEQDYSNAYVLFYQKQGTSIDFKVPEVHSKGEPEVNRDVFSMEMGYHPVPGNHGDVQSEGGASSEVSHPLPKPLGSDSDYDFYS